MTQGVVASIAEAGGTVGSHPGSPDRNTPGSGPGVPLQTPGRAGSFLGASSAGSPGGEIEHAGCCSCRAPETPRRASARAAPGGPSPNRASSWGDGTAASTLAPRHLRGHRGDGVPIFGVLVAPSAAVPGDQIGYWLACRGGWKERRYGGERHGTARLGASRRATVGP